MYREEWLLDPAEEMFKKVLECLDEGIHIVDSSGFTVFYNRAASLLDDLPVQEVLGKHVLEAFPSLTEKTSTLLKVLKTGEPVKEKQQTYMNSQGKQITTVNKTLPIRIKGKLIGAVEIAKDITRIKELSEKVIDLQEQIQEPKKKRHRIKRMYCFEDIITQNTKMQQAIERAKRVALSSSPVLVVGETGTGKELFVQSIHSSSPRKEKSFVVQNCAAIPSTLLESILFGTVKGAFTGAEDRLGLFELADGGTLFLDEIHAMPIDLQAKLLRVLEDGLVRRVGETMHRSVDVRIIVATNEDPLQSVREGRLRKDLFYRIHVVRIQLPPLRERKEDIPLLTHYFLRKLKEKVNSPVERCSDEVMDLFLQYDWPGNVRELEHTVEGALHLATDTELKMEHLPPHFASLKMTDATCLHMNIDLDRTLPEVLAEVEEKLIRKALNTSDGKILLAAEKLGIPRQTLQYKLKRLRMQRKS
ncbi:sigma-54 interaction domain-containing protein [Thermoflavimicrobium dichotomicum]|uniref:Arginine utilization regulatory protein n=1 Tax=Thermoflavimicrobium dichotomicum TaxID=46223 RepID=A0A1I3K7T3_9BACL|nr:arginine utilization regulatory protein [Thermoflavimicrobium dichotomicum]